MGKPIVWSKKFGKSRYLIKSEVKERALRPVGVDLTLLCGDSVFFGEGNFNTTGRLDGLGAEVSAAAKAF